MINNVDYSNWTNLKAIKLAEQVDKDGIKGLNSNEIIEFSNAAKENGIEEAELSELLGMNISKSKSKVLVKQNPMFSKAVDYYNLSLGIYERANITSKANTNLEQRLYNMEKAIDQAFIDCDAYKDIVIVPRRYYRFYPNFNDKLINFNLEEIRNLTSKDMDSLHALKDQIEYIMEDANGEDKHTEPAKTDFDIESLALKYLGMSYEEFKNKYSTELEFCKTVSAADFGAMTETQRMVYSRAKAYAAELLQTTINEAHTTNWDAGERKLDETLKATGDMFTISEFETDGITNDGLEKIKSGIMYKAFEDALVDSYSISVGIENITDEQPPHQSKKVLINGNVLIFTPDGSIYDTSGKKIK